jgi:phosphoglycolate phosphatase-like HAD superfamily hydrolase
MLADLQAQKNITVAFATGAWLESVIIKLRHARIDLSNIALATSSDAISREQIMQISEERANKTGKAFTTRIYVGDAIWDVQAAIRLGYHFIGVAMSQEAEVLQSKGARWIVPDYSDRDRFLSILNEILNTSSI